MKDPRSFILKVIKMRERIIESNDSQKNKAECFLAVKALKPWLDAYPNATPQQVAAHLRRHYNAVQVLLPGRKAPNALALQNEFHQIIKTQHHEPSISTR